MALIVSDRVREYSTTTGTGNIAVTGAVLGYRTFASVMSSGDTTYYTIADQGGANWEVGVGTFTYPATIVRGTVLSSSNSNNLVNFVAGSKDVFITLPASRLNNITSATANAFVVGPNGSTNPTLNIDASTTLSATGIQVKAAAAGSGVAISALSSGANEALKIDAKGTGGISIGSVSTGAVNIASGAILNTPASMVATNVTGTAAGLTAGRVSNANLTGDITTGTIGNSTTLATVVSAASVGSSTAIPTITFNAKGLVTGSSTSVVVAPAGTLSGATLASGVTASSLTSLGTIGSLSVTAGTITNPPAASNDIANKAYVDSIAQGLSVKDACTAATTINLTSTYNNGASGVGATLTNSSTLVAFTVDGYNANLNDRILVKNQTSSLQNGIYKVTTVGSSVIAWVLTRATDSDTWAKLVSAFTFILSGTTQANTSWVSTVAAGGTLGTTAVTWVQFSGAAAYTAGTGLTLAGTLFSLTAPVTVALGGTNRTSAGIASFNNITGYTASGATGTTSTNIVFSASPTLTGTLTAGYANFGNPINIGGATVASMLDVNTASLGSVLNNSVDIARFQTTTGNSSFIRFWNYRNSNGNYWDTASTRIQMQVDVTPQAYIEYNPLGSTYGMAIGASNSEVIRLTAAGNVGIGTTTPGYKLDVAGAINSSGAITGTWNGAVVAPVYGGTGTGTAFTSGSLVFSGASGVYNQNNSQLFWDNTNSRLGVGTTAPGYKLQVASNANSNDGIYVSNTNTGASAQAVVNVAAQGWNGVQLVQNRATGTAQVYLGDNAPLLLATNATTRMTILGDGKIGVGSTTPNSYKFPAQGDQYISNQFLTVGTSTLGPSVSGAIPTNAEFGIGIDFISNTGKYTGTAGTVASNKVGLQVTTTAKANSGNVWAFNPLLYLEPGSVAAGSAQIAEFDLAQYTNVNYGDTAGYAGALQPAVIGMQITGGGDRATAAIGILGAGRTTNSPLWNRGIVAYAYTIAQSFLEDYSNATQSYYLAGSHTYGINTIDGAFSGATIRLGAQQKISWRNQANSSDLNMLQSTSTDDLIVGTGATSLFFNASSASRMKITSVGYVGINTLSPVSQTHIVGADSVNILTVTSPTFGLRFGTAAATGAMIGAVGIDGVTGYQPLYVTGAQITLGLSGTGNGISLVSSGNVGIGTVSPGYKLHVASSTNGNDGLFVSNTSTGASAQAFINLVAQGWNGIQLVQTQATGNIQFYSGDNVPMSFATNASTRMFIEAAGNVGIGTTSPSGKLHINGADSANIATVTGASYGVRIGSAAGTGGTIAGVDSTGTNSYKPLYITGTTVTIGINGGANGLVIDGNYNIHPTAPVSTTMTGGFFCIPGASGAPTGTPAITTGYCAMYYDSTGHDFWVYDGAWRKVHLN